eukprot:scaffold83431_cov63-Phaeocystis_antarctica.AAC.4
MLRCVVKWPTRPQELGGAAGCTPHPPHLGPPRHRSKVQGNLFVSLRRETENKPISLEHMFNNFTGRRGSCPLRLPASLPPRRSRPSSRRPRPRPRRTAAN